MKDKSVLHLNLKKVWFDKILGCEKHIEYRELKKYWITRLTEDVNGTIKPKSFDYIIFKNGYSKDAPNFMIECKKITIQMNIETPLGRGDFFVIELGRLLSDNLL